MPDSLAFLLLITVPPVIFLVATQIMDARDAKKARR